MRLTTDTPNGNVETMLNFVYGKDGWAYIRHDGEHEDVLLTDWAKRHCLLHGCDEIMRETAEDIDQRLCDCMMDEPICPIAMAYCFASQAVHMRSRLKMYEDTMQIERVQELAQAEKDGRLIAHLPGETVYDRFGAPWIIESSEIHLIQGKLKQLFRCGHPGTEDYYAMYEDEIKTCEEAEAALKKREVAK